MNTNQLETGVAAPRPTAKVGEASPKKYRRNGGDKRGKAKDRRARKHWLLGHFGDGVEAGCVHCGEVVNFDSMEVDRISIGGPYRRDNVQPSCLTCNRDRGDQVDWVGANPQPLPDRPITGPGSYTHNGDLTPTIGREQA